MDSKSKTYNFLRWSEKYTKTDMVYLTTGGFWLVLGYIVSSIVGFLLAVAYANLLPKEVYGNYRYALSLLSILGIANLAGMETALTRAVAQNKEGSLMPAVKARMLWGMFGSITALFVAFYYYYFLNNLQMAMAFLIIAFFLPLMDPLGTYASFLNGKKLFNISTKYFIITQTASLITLLAALAATDNLSLILLSYFLPYTITRCIYLKITLKKFQTNQEEDPATISYGKHLTLMSTVTTIAAFLDRLLVFNYLGAAQLAVYSFAIAVPEQIKALLKGMNTLVLPKFSVKPKEDIKKDMWGKILKYGLFIMALILIYIFAAPFVFKIFFPKYLDSVFYSQIFALSLLGAVNTFPVSILHAHKAQKKLYIYNILSSTIEIIFLFSFFYFYGLWGIILARVFSRFMNLFASFWLIR